MILNPLDLVSGWLLDDTWDQGNGARIPSRGWPHNPQSLRISLMNKIDGLIISKVVDRRGCSPTILFQPRALFT